MNRASYLQTHVDYNYLSSNIIQYFLTINSISLGFGQDFIQTSSSFVQNFSLTTYLKKLRSNKFESFRKTTLLQQYKFITFFGFKYMELVNHSKNNLTGGTLHYSCSLSGFCYPREQSSGRNLVHSIIIANFVSVHQIRSSQVGTRFFTTCLVGGGIILAHVQKNNKYLRLSGE